MTREDLTEQYPAVGTVHPESPVFRALLVCVGYLGLCERFRRPSVPEVMHRCPGADIVEVARAEFVCASTMDTLHTAFRFRRGSLMKRDFWASWQASTPDRHRIRARAAPCRAAHWHVASHHQEEERRSDHSRNTFSNTYFSFHMRSTTRHSPTPGTVTEDAADVEAAMLAGFVLARFTTHGPPTCPLTRRECAAQGL